MIELLTGVAGVALVAALIRLGYWIGEREGLEKGQDKARRVLLRALEVRSSFTTHMALITISGNQTLEEMVKELKGDA